MEREIFLIFLCVVNLLLGNVISFPREDTVVDLEEYFANQLENDSKERVVGGYAVPENENIAYQVSMQFRTKDGKDRHFCGGSIISPNRVLTAAHCVNGQDAKKITVVAGIRDLTDKSGVRSKVQSYEMHENYQELVTSDIAILQIDPPFALDGVKIDKINVSGKENVEGGTPVTLTGWGAIWFIGQGPLANYPTRLQRMSYKTLNNEECKKTMTQLTDTEICALERFGKGACNGDSGGPLVIDNNGKFKQVGIVSYGTAPCATNRPDVYTRVSMFDEWIMTRIA